MRYRNVKRRTKTLSRTARRKTSVSSKVVLTQDLLVPNSLYAWADEYRRGRVVDNQPVHPNPPHRVSDVRPLVRSNFDWQVLNQLLRKEPELIGHPVILALVGHLHHCLGNDPFISDRAKRTLHSLLQEWLSALLPGWRLHPPKRRRGK